ncbi:MbtH family protein [Streptomyces cinnamoneus]|uniref:MbtH family protein n=1 Tax=Streptomyces cinnamoneus TaxID=53446 RepID=UPI0037BB9469
MTDGRVYQVVVNHEEQHSIWDSEMEVPAGWTPVGVSGSRAKCLAYIDRTWTDITPLSVRVKYSRASS